MLSQERNKKQKPLIRLIILILTILLSKNIKVEIITPEIEVKVSTQSLSLESVTKLIEWF